MPGRKFWSGWITQAAGLSLYQDYLGKEEYLRRAEYGWADAIYTVPLALFMLVLAMGLHADRKPEDEK